MAVSPSRVSHSAAWKDTPGSLASGTGQSATSSPASVEHSSDTSSSGPQVLTFALQHRPRATRASVPKVRTGCITCKKRHVKCDETKPSCQRCVKRQGYCGGYENGASDPEVGDGPAPPPSSTTTRQGTNGSKRRKAAKTTTAPAKKGQSAFQVATSASRNATLPIGSVCTMAVVRAIPTEPDTNNSFFAHGWEKIYFDHWLDMSANIGGGFFQSKLWTQTMPQIARSEPALRNAAMAIGALAASTTCRILPGSSSTLVAQGPHYNNALAYYGRALRAVRLCQGSVEDQLRSAVLCCLLFVCFETLHGNRNAAQHHVSHGLQVMDQFLSAQCGPGREVLTDSPAPSVLEDEILQVFHRLDFQSWSTGILRSRRQGAAPHGAARRLMERRTRPPVHEIPGSFADLFEARRWWDLVQHWVLAFPRRMAALSTAMRERLPPEEGAKVDLCDVPGVRGEQGQYLECVERWRAAFEPLHARAREARHEDPDNHLRSCSLRLQYQMAWICIHTLCFSEYERMYAITPQFREVVRLSGLLMAARWDGEGGGVAACETFTMDNGPTMALFVAATKCRDAGLRAEALDLLRRHPRRDGFWDGRALTAVADWCVPLEMVNATEGDEKEQYSRLRQRECIFHDKVARATLRYMKRVRPGEWVLAEEEVTW